jgi:hypothetical protein
MRYLTLGYYLQIAALSASQISNYVRPNSPQYLPFEVNRSAVRGRFRRSLPVIIGLSAKVAAV